MKKVLARLRNKKIVLGAVSGFLMILVNMEVIDLTMSDLAMDVVNSVLTLGVAVGIFSNPSSHLDNNE